jgi:hypothetical protein
MKGHRILKVAIMVFSLLFSGAIGVLFAQNANTGEIRGTVTDSSGAVIPDVQVTITNVGTGVSTMVKTNSTGVYDVPTLLPGAYSVEFSKPGFSTFVRKGVTLGVQVIGVDAQLKVGAVSQEVTVTAATPLVQTETSESSTTLPAETITTLPNVGLTWYNYQANLPGVAPGGISWGGAAMSVNGAAPYTSNWLINGATDTFTANNNNPDVVGDVPLDSIAEVHAETNNFSVQYGNGPSVFNVITKSGTNQWHGSLFEYNQNTIFEARNFFAPTTSPWHWNEFGGTVGGPIKRDKAFFFFSFQRKDQVTYSPSYMTVPTPAMRTGDFSAAELPTVYDPASLSNGVRTPLPNNAVPASAIDPVAAKIQQYFPQPNLPGIYNNYYVNLENAPYEPWYSGTVDYNVSSNNRVTGFLMFVPAYLPEPSQAPYSWDAGYYLEQQESLTDSWSISPTTVNQFHFGALRYAGHFIPPGLGQNLPQQLGLLNPAANLFPCVGIGGAISTYIGCGADAWLIEGSYVPSDVLTIVKGKHVIKVGGEYDKLYSNETAWGDLQEGNFTFSGIFTRNPADPESSGLGYADFLYGLPQTWSATEYPMMGSRAWNAQLFAGDDYKVTPKLTLNFGLRYLMTVGWSEEHNRLADFDPSLTNPATNTPGAMWFAGQLGRKALENSNLHGLSPRLGFAWSPKNGWSIRGAYGIFDQVWAGANYNGGEGEGYEVTGYETSTDLITPIFSLSPPSASLQAAYPSLVQGPPLPLQPTGTPSATFLNGTPVSYYPLNTPIAYIQQAHFDVQHQLPHGIFVDAGYVWTRGVHLPFQRDIDQVPASLLGPGNAQLNRPYPQYDGIWAMLDDGISNYNAFQLTVKHEFAQGLMFTANYTWSKAMDTQTVSNWFGGDAGLVQNSYSPRANYGLGNMDMPNIFNVSFVYQLPFGQGKHFVNQPGILNGIVGGWRVSSGVYVHSGSPYTPTMGTANLSGSLADSWYPNRIASGKVPNPNISEWFDPTAFTEPAAYTFGDSGRNVLLGPGYRDVDLSLDKSFPIRKLGEAGKLEFRADAFDLFNFSNWGFPNSSIGTSGVGVISYSNTSRNFQLGLRLSF